MLSLEKNTKNINVIIKNGFQIKSLIPDITDKVNVVWTKNAIRNGPRISLELSITTT